MAKPLSLSLTDTQRRELEVARDTHAKAHLREKAAALLKIADGQAANQVAKNGLLKARAPRTLSRWLRRYQKGGLAGLLVAKGRGRKPAYFPQASGC